MRKGSNETTGIQSTRLALVEIDTLPTVTLSISTLLLGNSPRQDGDNEEHARVLAESEDQLPPIVVHGPSMQVIDGIHRVRAAMIRGEKIIKAKIYHGTDDDAFLFAVRLNIAHGLPLTRADRTAAALRIIESRPQWSDRMIATIVGLSAGTVAKIRRRSTAQNAQSTVRVGKDGRVRPVNSAVGRLKAAELVAEKPTSSNRVIANEAQVSASTVQHIRQRLRAGQPPLAEHHKAQELPVVPEPRDASPGRGVPDYLALSTGISVTAILDGLKRDPALQLSDPAKSLLRSLDRYRVEMSESSKIIEMVPDHCAHAVAKLAREYARVWTEIAARLEQR